MENKELKNLELTDDQLERTNGGVTNHYNNYEFITSDPLINHDGGSAEPIEEVTPSIP